MIEDGVSATSQQSAANFRLVIDAATAAYYRGDAAKAYEMMSQAELELTDVLLASGLDVTEAKRLVNRVVLEVYATWFPG